MSRLRGFTRIELLVVLCILLVISCVLVPAAEMTCELLVLGWFRFLLRVSPEMRPAWDQVAVFVLGVIALTVLLHFTCRRFAASWSLWNSLRLVGVVLLGFVAGTAFVGLTHQTGWLLTSKEPLVRRTSERYAQMASANNLRSLVTGAHNHVEDRQRLPLGVLTSPGGEPLHGWPTLLLPYIEQDALFKQIDRTRPWDDPANAKATHLRVSLYEYPGVPVQTAEGWPAIHYAANVHVLGGERPRKLTDFEAGTSNTIAFGEAGGNFQPWAAPFQWRDPALGLGHPNGFGNPASRRQVLVGMLDGSVRIFEVGKDDATFRTLGGGIR
jgi:hypothetical protein